MRSGEKLKSVMGIFESIKNSINHMKFVVTQEHNIVSGKYQVITMT